MARGFTDSSGRFRPTDNNSTSSREKTIEPTGTRIGIDRKAMTQGRMKRELERKLEDPQIFVRDNVLVLSGEDGNKINGIPAFDYYEEVDSLMRDAQEEFGGDFKPTKTYDGGIHKEMRQWLDERGWYAEWADAGTVHLVEK